MNRRLLPILLVFMGPWLLNGCQSAKVPLAKTPSSVKEPDDKAMRETQDLKQCQQNLSVLGMLKQKTMLFKNR